MSAAVSAPADELISARMDAAASSSSARRECASRSTASVPRRSSGTVGGSCSVGHSSSSPPDGSWPGSSRCQRPRGAVGMEEETTAGAPGDGAATPETSHKGRANPADPAAIPRGGNPGEVLQSTRDGD
ncbi:unnamed protein product [Lampetra fluviatilis]